MIFFSIYDVKFVRSQCNFCRKIKKVQHVCQLTKVSAVYLLIRHFKTYNVQWVPLNPKNVRLNLPSRFRLGYPDVTPDAEVSLRFFGQKFETLRWQDFLQK